MPEVRSAIGWHLGDAVLAIGVWLGIVILGNLDHLSAGLESFLAIRFSLKNVILVTAFSWAWPAALTLCGLHQPGRLRSGKGEWPRLLVAGSLGAAMTLAFPLTSQSGMVSPVDSVLFGLAIVPATWALRAAYRFDERRRVQARPRRVLFAGSGPLTAELYRNLLADPLDPVAVIGFVDADPQPELIAAGVAHLGAVKDLESILMQGVVDEVLVGLPVPTRYEDIRQVIAACHRLGVPVSYSANLFGGAPAGLRQDTRGTAVLSFSGVPSPDRLASKRILDVVVATVSLVMLAPVMLLVALAIKLTSPGPVLFRQERFGFMKRRFSMLKFRTMVVDAEQRQAALESRNEGAGPLFKMKNDPRVTPIGRFLRRSSLDELPQIWHVLTGEMSLVGPRPLPNRDVSRFNEPWLMRRFSMPPGLTCLWQVSGRSTLDFERWAALDLEYVDRWSLRLDLEILIRTVPAVLRGSGAS